MQVKGKIEFDGRDKEYKWRFWGPGGDSTIDSTLEELSKILQSPTGEYWHYGEFDFITESGNISHYDPSWGDGKVILKIYENADEKKLKEILGKSAEVLKLMRASEEQIAKILTWKPEK